MFRVLTRVRASGARTGGRAALVASLMLAAVAVAGGNGNTALAAGPSIQSISVNSACDATTGGFTGVVTLSGNATATITLGLFYHVPGNSTFVDSRLRATATFANSSTAPYSFAAFTFTGANTYRIQVINAGGLGGATVKSNSVPPCTGSTPPPPPACTVPGATGPSFLGLCTQGSILDSDDAGSPNGSQIVVGSQPENVTSICADVGPVDTAHNDFSFAIYTDNSGVPNALVATSGTGSLTANSWNCLSISGGLQANTTYWLMYNTDAASGSNNNLYYNPVASPIGAFSTNFAPAGTMFPWSTYNPFGGVVTGGWQFSIFANVSP